MAWKHPEVLWGLLLVGVPLLIHLFFFRRHRKVPFSNVALLQELRRRTQRMRRLRHWVAWALRTLAVAAVVLAFAQPFRPVPSLIGGAGERITLFIDNSWSMSYLPPEEGKVGVDLLSEARQRALELVAVLPEGVRVQVLTHDFSPSEELFVSPAEARQRIQRVQFSAVQRTLPQIERRLRDNIYGTPPTRVFLFSDFQASLAPSDTLDWPFAAYAVPCRPTNIGSLRGMWIERVTAASPVLVYGRRARLGAVIRWEDTVPPAAPYAVVLGGRVVDEASATPEGGAGRSTVRFEFPVRQDLPTYGFVASEGAKETFRFAQRYYITLPVVERVVIRYVYASRPHPFITAVFADDSVFELVGSAASEWRPDLLEGVPLVIAEASPQIPRGVWHALQQYVQAGGNVLLVPHTDDPGPVWRLWGLPSVVQWVANTDYLHPGDHPFFDDVFQKSHPATAWPQVTKRPILSSSAGTALLRGAHYGGRYFLLHSKGRGSVYQLVLGLEDPDNPLPRHALWVPLLIKPAFYGREQPLAYFPHQAPVIEVPSGIADTLSVLHAVGLTDSFRYALSVERSGRGVRVPLHAIRYPGVYRLEIAGTSDSVGRVAVNVERSECVPSYLDDERLRRLGLEVVADERLLQGGVGGRSAGWRWLLIAAVTFLLAEMWVLRTSHS